MSEIQFAVTLRDTRGNDIEEDKAGSKMTLARACEIALDSALPSDQGEGLKAKLRRGRLIEEISVAAKEIKPLVLDAEAVTLLKERVASTFTAASFVRMVCLLLDPATKE